MFPDPLVIMGPPTCLFFFPWTEFIVIAAVPLFPPPPPLLNKISLRLSLVSNQETLAQSQVTSKTLNRQPWPG